LGDIFNLNTSLIFSANRVESLKSEHTTFDHEVITHHPPFYSAFCPSFIVTAITTATTRIILIIIVIVIIACC
jgi:hypothetical protein